MISKELNIGRAGEYIALADILLQGYQSFDSAQGVNYDLVLDLNGRLIKVQVKSTSKKKQWDPKIYSQKLNPTYHFHIRRAGKGSKRVYGKDEFDLYALVMLDIKHVSYILNKDIPQARITLRDENIKYANEGGSKGRALYYQDLTLEKALNKLICLK